MKQSALKCVLAAVFILSLTAMLMLTACGGGNGNAVQQADADGATCSPTPAAEATATPTPEPTPTPTPEPTPAPTPAPTPEPTPAPTPEPAPEPTPDPIPTPASQPLLGTWVWMGIPYYVFEDGGFGTMGGADMRWTASGRVLQVCGTPAMCGDVCLAPTEWYFEIEGNQLTLTSRWLSSLYFVYTRQ